MTASVTLDVSEVVAKFPTFRVAVMVARDLKLTSVRTPAIDAFVAESESISAAAMAGSELSDIPELVVWREAYKAFGVKKTSYRSSVERLLKSVQRGTGLPRINSLVDIYNAMSARHRMPIGADDLDHVRPPLAFRYARSTDSFIALGDAGAIADTPKEGEIVYADAEKCLCRRWNWYQDARSACSLSTTQAVLTVQSLSPATGRRLEEVAQELSKSIIDSCGGEAGFIVADGQATRVSIG